MTEVAALPDEDAFRALVAAALDPAASRDKQVDAVMREVVVPLMGAAYTAEERLAAVRSVLQKVAAYCQVRADKSNRTLPRTVHVADILAIISTEEGPDRG